VFFDICDECEKAVNREDLINLDPGEIESDQLKDEYKNFDGMVCKDCFEKMEESK